jgi:hypothetical protein
MTVPAGALRTSVFFAPPLAVQTMRQLVDGELMITNNIFDQIADRDDSHQLSLVDDGKVANSLVSHHRRAFLRSQIGSDEQDGGLHNVPHARDR